ncbi:MAG: isoprenylcysteine carboxylmethyltransferase family protein [Wenzhouxiangellaceae bacterium]
MAVIKKLLPFASYDVAWTQTAAAVFLLSGIALGVLGGGRLERSDTTSDPTQLDQANVLVTGGIYRFSRNPMYLGFLLILTACALYLQNLLCFAALPVFIVAMTRLQIVPEERALRQRFGDRYREYQQRVRRWL